MMQTHGFEDRAVQGAMAERRTPSAWPVVDRIGAVRAMIEDLGWVGPGARQGVMEDIVHLLRAEALEPSFTPGASQLRSLTGWLDDLEHEVSQVSPDVAAFDRKAQGLVALFTAADRFRQASC
jgi:hypothetical protein